jgi:hypothetical protein
MAHDDRVREDPRLELEVHRTILPYVAPKLASVEVKEGASEDRRIVVSLFETRELPNGSMVDVEVPLVTEVCDIVPIDR